MTPTDTAGFGSISRDQLVEHLDELLDSPTFDDFGPNGLQVEGTDSIRSVVTGVSACLELFEQAAKRNADAVLVHHGLFWKGDPLALTGFRYRRVAQLVDAKINLLAYHLPLDAHAELGNNALGLELLGVKKRLPFAEFGGGKIGFHGALPEPLSFETFLDSCQSVFGSAPLAFAAGPPQVSRVGLVSGGGSRAIHEAIELDLDVFITGEPNEWIMNVAREAGIHFVAAGHYATERLGIRALGEHLAQTFGLAVDFLDIPNPI